jgi:hypothetical protein
MRFLLLALAALALSACGGGSSGGGADATGGPDVSTPLDGAAADDTAPGGPDGVTPPGAVAVALFGMDPEVTAFTEARLAVKVRVYDPGAARPLAGVPVDFALEVVTGPAVGSADGTLEETLALSDSDGRATVIFATGSGSDAVYRITVTAAGAPEPVVLTVTVQAPATGGIRVTFDYRGDSPPTTVRVLLLTAILQCDGFNPGAPPATPYSADVPFADGSWSTLGLQQSPNWNVLLVGLDAAGSVVAGGCSQQVRVVADVTTNVAVTMTPVGLHLPGTYDWSETLDLSAALPTDVATFGDRAATLFEDSWDALEAGLRTAITERLTPLDPDLACVPLWEAAVGPAVEGVAAAHHPWVNGLRTGALADLDTRLAAALSAVTLEAGLIVRGAAPGPFTGDLTWRALSLPFGGRTVRWEPSDLAAVVYPIRLANDTTTWAARVDGYDDLVVTEHALVLEPGRIAAALVLEEALAASPAAPARLADLALDLFDCAAVAAALPGDVTTCLADEQIAVEDVRATCQAVVRELAGAPGDLLAGWVTPAVTLTLTGTGTLVDADRDLGVDRVDDGALTGALTVGGTPGAAVGGTFTMAR